MVDIIISSITIVISTILMLFVIKSSISVCQFLKNFCDDLIEESKLWREAYVAKEHGPTISDNNTTNSTGFVKEQPDMEQSNNSAMETSVQPEDYAHLFSKTTKTAVQFGEDVKD